MAESIELGQDGKNIGTPAGRNEYHGGKDGSQDTGQYREV
jgi:hypothetical protein